MGGLLGVMPWALLIGLVCWLVIFYSTRYVAVASLGFGMSLPLSSLIAYWQGSGDQGEAGSLVLACLVMGWIVWRHRDNIIRLRKGTENRFDKKKKP